MVTDEAKKALFGLKEYRFVKFHKVLQNLFYLIGMKKEDINKPGTNILNWRVVRNTLFNEEMLEKLFQYEFKGPKENKVETYAYINRLKAEVERIGKFSLCSEGGIRREFSRLSPGFRTFLASPPSSDPL